jgi:trehalose 6-phosphate synthase
MLIHHSAWWGESFVTELRRISEASDRKVRITSAASSRPVTGAGPADKKPADAAAGAPLGELDSTPAKDKETDPAAAAQADKEATEALERGLPLQPKHAATN